MSTHCSANMAAARTAAMVSASSDSSPGFSACRIYATCYCIHVSLVAASRRDVISPFCSMNPPRYVSVIRSHTCLSTNRCMRTSLNCTLTLNFFSSAAWVSPELYLKNVERKCSNGTSGAGWAPGDWRSFVTRFTSHFRSVSFTCTIALISSRDWCVSRCVPFLQPHLQQRDVIAENERQMNSPEQREFRRMMTEQKKLLAEKDVQKWQEVAQKFNVQQN